MHPKDDFHKVPIVAVSANDHDMVYLKKCHEVKMKATLKKPVTKEDLEGLLKKFYYC